MKINQVCDVIAQARRGAVIVSTMGSMVALDNLKVGQPRIDSVPLMGGAAGLGLGLALARPDDKIIVIDGDASLLMQLGVLVTVCDQRPVNFYHFVIHNGTQFTGFCNLPLPGPVDMEFSGFAKSAGYATVLRFRDIEPFQGAIDGILNLKGPVFVELHVAPEDVRFLAPMPQAEMPGRQFTRMGEGASALTKHLEMARKS